MGGVRVYPGPPLEHDKIRPTLKRVNNRDRESNVNQKLLKPHNRLTVDVKKEFGVRLEELGKAK
jgi:hypothetical protein